MENIYTLTGRYQEINDKYDTLMAQLDEMYEVNGGEVTEATQAQEEIIAQVEEMKKGIIADIIEHADDYAAIAKNKEAQKKVLEAEMKAVMAEQAKILDRYKAKIERLGRSASYWKECFAYAMDVENVEKIGGAKTDHKFSIYFTKTKSVEVDEEKVMAPYSKVIEVMRKNLPEWVTLKVGVSKTELKKVEEMPEGAELVETRTLQIR